MRAKPRGGVMRWLLFSRTRWGAHMIDMPAKANTPQHFYDNERNLSNLESRAIAHGIKLKEPADGNS